MNGSQGAHSQGWAPSNPVIAEITTTKGEAMQGKNELQLIETVHRHQPVDRTPVAGAGDQVLRFVIDSRPVIVFTYDHSSHAPQVFTYEPTDEGRDLAERQWRQARANMGDPLERRACACGFDLTDTMGVDDGRQPLRCLSCATQGRTPNQPSWWVAAIDHVRPYQG